VLPATVERDGEDGDVVDGARLHETDVELVERAVALSQRTHDLKGSSVVREVSDEDVELGDGKVLPYRLDGGHRHDSVPYPEDFRVKYLQAYTCSRSFLMFSNPT